MYALRQIGVNTVVNGFLASQFNKNVVIIHNAFTTYLHHSNIVSGGYEIVIINTNNNNGVNIARLLHYGHGTGTGGWVPGTHYITTAVSEAYSDSIKTVLESMTK